MLKKLISLEKFELLKKYGIFAVIVAVIIGLGFLSTNVGGIKNIAYIVGGLSVLGGIFYLWRIDAIKSTISHLKKRWYWYLIAIILTFITLYIFEGAWIHSYLMVLREYMFVVFFLPVMFFSFKLLIKKETDTWIGKVVVASLAFIVTGAIATYIYLGGQQYIAQYFKYQEIKEKIVWINELPESDVRAFPRDLYKTALQQKYGDNNLFSDPDLILEGNQTKMVSTYVPFKRINKFTEGKIENIVRIDADKTNIDGHIKLEKVNFSVGEDLVWSRDIYNYVIKSLHLKYFDVFPTNVQPLINDQNKTVFAVSLAKWSGWFFPTPEFYGVAIVEQGQISWIKRAIFGGAKIIKKENISDYNWLIGQNINSEFSTRYIAESLKFENGFFAPMSFVHNDDVVVTDMDGDRNELPLVTAFTFKLKKLYDFYELKPWIVSSTNARAYLFIPSDGQETIYGYKPKGVVSIAELTNKVKGSVDYNTEEKYAFVEPRPYFKKELPEAFIVSRVLKRKDGSFDPSGVKTYLVNAQGTQNRVIEVPTYNQEKWLSIAIKAFRK